MTFQVWTYPILQRNERTHAHHRAEIWVVARIRFRGTVQSASSNNAAFLKLRHGAERSAKLDCTHAAPLRQKKGRVPTAPLHLEYHSLGCFSLDGLVTSRSLSSYIHTFTSRPSGKVIHSLSPDATRFLCRSFYLPLVTPFCKESRTCGSKRILPNSWTFSFSQTFDERWHSRSFSTRPTIRFTVMRTLFSALLVLAAGLQYVLAIPLNSNDPGLSKAPF